MIFGSKLDKYSIRIIKAIILIIGLFIIFMPFIWMISTSIKPLKLIYKIPPVWIPRPPTLDAFKYLFSSVSLFPKFFLNSIIVCLLNTFISLTCAVLAAYSFSRYKFRGSKPLLIFILSSQMFPPVMFVISLYVIYRHLHLLNNYFGLAISYSSFTLPFAIWMLKNYFDIIPKEIEDAAKIDGCSRFRIIIKIIIPLTAPALISVTIFSFLVAWNDLLFAMTLMPDNTKQTLPPGLLLTFVGNFQVYWSEMMAASLIVTTPMVILFIFLQRYVIQGLTGGAVKG